MGGTITVACTGSTISNWGLTPDQGWKGTGERHSSELEAKFTSLGEDDREVEVKITCSANGPRFQVERHGSEENEDDGSDD